MGVIGAALRELIAVGVTGDALVTAIERIEEAGRTIRSAAAERMIAYRLRKKEADEASRVTHGDATPLPNREIPQTPLEINPSPVLVNSDTSPVRARGTRLPENFEPDLGEALALGILLERAEGEAAKFKDHFAAAPGQRGVKLDWPATWRNWCRRAAEDNPRGGTGPPKARSQNGYAAFALSLAESHYGPTDQYDGSPPAHDAGASPATRRVAAPDRILDAERSDKAGQPRSGTVDR